MCLILQFYKDSEKFLSYQQCYFVSHGLSVQNTFPSTPCRKLNNDLVTVMNKISIYSGCLT